MKYRLGELIESVSKTYDLKNKKEVTKPTDKYVVFF